MRDIKTIGLVVNSNKPYAEMVLKNLAAKARALGLKLAASLPEANLVPGVLCLEPGQMIEEIDLLMVLGGDGTMLRAVRLLKGKEIPVLGVNLGSLGFLTSVAQDQAEYALECIAQKKFTLQPRQLAECAVYRDGKQISHYLALNDVVIERGASVRIVTLDLLVDGKSVASYICDGLIITTPTGSTGHSLSAGGPILHPEAAVWGVSLICPHTLSSRPLVISNKHTVTVAVSRCVGSLLLAVDGQVGEDIQALDQVRVCAGPAQAHFVLLPDYDYFAVLRQKLHWRGSNFA